MDKRVLIINTGGTISAVKTDKGYTPKLGYVKEVMDNLSLFKHKDLPKFDIIEYSPLIDSSNMTIDDWNQIASDIEKNYDVYDGFIVLHGTDTMAFTASALSFVLENLSKPVILTGSQIPLTEVRNDAIDNIISALWLCAHAEIPEVCIYFNQKLLRGNCSTKLSAEHFDAFDSPNCPPLAIMGTKMEIAKHLILPKPRDPFRRQHLFPQLIANFRLFPGFSVEILEGILNQPLKALILETYGTGNAPNQNQAFLDCLKAAIDRGVIIVNRTQCTKGSVQMEQYATGNTLKNIGLISADNMTAEATHARLMYLLSSPKIIDESIQTTLHL
jgi:L-asparaginase